MSNLIKIVSKTGECLCKGCHLFADPVDIYCPISQNKENKVLEGELFPEWPQDSTDKTTWCRFKHCGMKAGDQDDIWHNPGYKVKGLRNQFMWIPESIVEPIKEEKQKIKRKARSLLARLGTRI